MPASKAAAPALPKQRELPLAPHLSGPLEAPWLAAYEATQTTLIRKLGSTLASFAKPPRKQ